MYKIEKPAQEFQKFFTQKQVYMHFNFPQTFFVCFFLSFFLENALFQYFSATSHLQVVLFMWVCIMHGCIPHMLGYTFEVLLF